MHSVFATCVPRSEVLEGELQEDIFAARLKDVLDGRAVAVYQKPSVFFENTYPTTGLRSLLQESLGRLTGAKASGSPVIRLETAFGGGKTHNLIALYHAASGAATPEMLGDLVDAAYVPRKGDVLVAGVVGSDLDPTTGLYHAVDNVRTFTLWGELAYQLGGRAGYALARESDQNKSAPGTGLFAELISEHQPVLIMIDELARHMRVAQTVTTATGKSDLAEQTVAFLMSLLEFAASRSNAVVVLTLAGSGDAFADETEGLRKQLAEAHKVSARQERVITPTGETEIAAIVRHRLFSHIDRQAAAETVKAFSAAYERWLEQNVALPNRAVSSEYAQGMATAYPFHPELLNALTLRVATIPNFQKTRGALRLLALAVRALWRSQPANAWLISPYHVDLRMPEIAEELTSRLQRPAFKQVIDADIVSPQGAAPGHAYQIDGAWVAAGKPRYARRVATAVFLHSLVQGATSGIDPADLLLATLNPGDEPLLVQKAAERLYDKGWFFEWDGLRYRFKPEPSINKIVNDEMEMVGKSKAKEELDTRIRKVWKTGTFKVIPFPQEANNLEDDADLPKLAVMHYDAVTATASRPAPPDLVRRLAERSGTQEGFRRFRNNVLFLVADGDREDDMVRAAQRYLAINRIAGDAERMSEFTGEQRKKIKKLGESTELDVRVAITKVYRHLYFPSADAPQADANLVHELLPAQDQGRVNQDQSSVVLHALRQQQKALTGNEPLLSAAFVKSRAWDKNQVFMTTEELRKAFARRLSLPQLLDLNQLKRTIQNGIKTQVWIYYDARAEMGYDHESPPPAIQITDEAYLYLPTEATRMALPVKGKTPQPRDEEEERCEVCGQPASACTCGLEIPDVTPPEKQLLGAGVPQQAFQQLLDACFDRKVTQLQALKITLRGADKQGAVDMRLLGMVIPQVQAKDAVITLHYTAEFGAGYIQVITNHLTWDHYRQLKQVTDDLARGADSFHIELTLRLEYPDGLAVEGDRFRTVHEIMTTVGLGVIQVEGETPAEVV
ncbi:MAG: ATP-binding protein [Anaerolineae bacterium]|nr:ATP-binding protein [Anaerolineae bacterium]